MLPYSPDRPALLAERVYLPQKEFLQLYNQAYPDQIHDADTPASSQVVAAFYKSGERKQLKDADWSQTFTVRYVIRSFVDTASNVRLPIRGIAITFGAA